MMLVWVHLGSEARGCSRGHNPPSRGAPFLDGSLVVSLLLTDIISILSLSISFIYFVVSTC